MLCPLMGTWSPFCQQHTHRKTHLDWSRDSPGGRVQLCHPEVRVRAPGRSPVMLGWASRSRSTSRALTL